MKLGGWHYEKMVKEASQVQCFHWLLYSKCLVYVWIENFIRHMLCDMCKLYIFISADLQLQFLKSLMFIHIFKKLGFPRHGCV